MITRMFLHLLDGMESREPLPRDWHVAQRVCDVLEVPCKTVVKSQSKGHWILPDAVARMSRIYSSFRRSLRTAAEGPAPSCDPSVAQALVVATAPAPTEGPYRTFSASQLNEVDRVMKETIMKHLDKFLKPVMEYTPEGAHIAMALLCDPRHRRGEIFYWMCDPDKDGEEKLQRHRSMMSEYTDKHLIPAMVTYKARTSAINIFQPSPCVRPTGTGASEDVEMDQVPDNLLDDDVTISTNDDVQYDRLCSEARGELTRFRAKASVTITDKLCPLTWWRENESSYPMLSNVARIALGCPGSQIECERVFSLCGITVSLLRNRMTTDNLAQTVYVSKNVDQTNVLASILAGANGMAAAESFLNHKSATSHYTHRPLMEWEVKEVDVYEEIDMFTDSDAATTSFTTISDSMDEEVALQTPHDWDDVVQVDDSDDDL